MGWGSGNLGGGLSLNFQIKAYASKEGLLSDTPKENTIGIQTVTKISGWHISPIEPSDVADGVVWISSGAGSSIVINAVKKNVLEIRPGSVRQMIGGSFETKFFAVYQNGKWNESAKIIVENGDANYEIVAIGKKISAGGSAMPSQTVSSSDGFVAISADGFGYGMAYVENIDLTDSKSITIEGEFDFTSEYVSRLAIWSSVGSYLHDNIVKYVDMTKSGGVLDVSELYGKFVVGITMSGKKVQKIRNWRID